jgi:hypothetical protein
MKSTNENWATVENFSRFVNGMNGGKDAGVSGRLPGFATYTEIGDSIVAQEKELTEEELDTLLDLYDIIDPVPTSAGVACELCGQYVDRYMRCGCDD